jgi:hypothetical protein
MSTCKILLIMLWWGIVVPFVLALIIEQLIDWSSK